MTNEMSFVVAAYALTWIVLAAYTGHVWRRVSRAERELRDDERGAR
ncbi:MAG TPA: heme exporter protein CcmD [Gemmatimonadaceae bacterium]|nr:heme exporter protein CcmD [Gemmatimonadaceae bacterium]